MELSKNRFEAFSDGVMAIIITIIVLQIPLAADFSIKGILTLLYLIFIFFVSFFIVGYFWNKHHAVFDKVDKITNKIVWRNMFFLFFLALLPIFTRWVLENPTELVPVVSYDILFVLLNLSYFILIREVFKDQYNERVTKAKKMKGDPNKEHTPLQIGLMVLAILILIVIAVVFPEITIILSMGFPLIFALVGMFFEDREQMKEVRESKMINNSKDN